MKCYSAIKRNAVLLDTTTWVNLEDILLSEIKSDREREKGKRKKKMKTHRILESESKETKTKIKQKQNPQKTSAFKTINWQENNAIFSS